jgi:hypothetical protein
MSTVIEPRILDALAGAALGLFLGLLVGLTTSPVAAAVVGSVAALATAFIGLGDKIVGAEWAPSTIRLTAFSLCAASFMLFGMYMRTHDYLAPTPQESVQALRDAKFPEKDALDIVRFTRFGLVPAGGTVAASDNPIVRSNRVTLYSAPADVCTQMTRNHSAEVAVRLSVLLNSDDASKDIAHRIQSTPPERQAALLDAAEFYLCGIR